MKNPELKNLTDYSPADKPWDEHRSFSDDVGGIYLRAAGFEHYGERVGACSGILRFGWSTNTETGETRLRLRDARFCRVRH
ncbi:Replication protein, partial [Macrococcoides caseolyticum]